MIQLLEGSYKKHMDYISTKDAAIKFGISDRRVQKLCESGRIPGSQMISGVWLIPSLAEKPVDERFTQLSFFDSTDVSLLPLSELCKTLSISVATGRNWIKLGKLTPTSYSGKTPVFSDEYVSQLKSELSNGSNKALKSRRNKKYVSGNEIYKSYVSKDTLAINTVQEVLDLIVENQVEVADLLVRALLAECAIQLLAQRLQMGFYNLKSYLMDKTQLKDFSFLIDDLIKNCDVDSCLQKYHYLFDLSYMYEDTEDTLGLLYISLSNIGERKAKGAYYTPTNVVKNLIGGLERSLSLLDKDIVDPCCGTGNFLLQLPSEINVENIYGYDIDELSILITRINVALKYQQANAELLYHNFCVKNYLLEDSGRHYDVIIGNPPWGYDFSEKDKAILCEKYQSAEGKSVESYDVFIEQALRDLNTNGVLSFVLPEAILNVKSHMPLRKILVEKTSIQYLEMLGNAFDKVQCPCIIIQIVLTNENMTTEGMAVSDGKRSFIINSNRNVSPELFSFLTTDDEYRVIKKIESIENKMTLEGNAIFALGIVTGNNKEYISQTKTSKNEMILKGSDIYKYRFQESENFIIFKPESFQQIAPTEYYRASEKLLYRFICNQLVFAYDNKQTLSLNSCNILIPTLDGVDIKYVMAVLNSRVAQFYFKKQFNSVKVLRSHIEQIPIPYIEQEKQLEILRQIDILIDNQDEKTAVEAYDELDTLISQLFGLTNREYELIKDYLEGENLFLL